MDNLERLKKRTNEPDEALLEDLLLSARSAIMSRRYPFQDWPETLERRYEDLQFRIALAVYNKRGGEYETSHSENSVTRVFSSEGIPKELLDEIIPLAATVK